MNLVSIISVSHIFSTLPAIKEQTDTVIYTRQTQQERTLAMKQSYMQAMFRIVKLSLNFNQIYLQVSTILNISTSPTQPLKCKLKHPPNHFHFRIHFTTYKSF